MQGFISSAGNIDSGGQGGAGDSFVKLIVDLTGITPTTETVNNKEYKKFTFAKTNLTFKTVTPLGDEETIAVDDALIYNLLPISNNNEDKGFYVSYNGSTFSGYVLAQENTLTTVTFMFTYYIILTQTSVVWQNYVDMVFNSGGEGVQERSFLLKTATSNEYSLNVTTGVLEGNLDPTQVYDSSESRYLTLNEYRDLLKNGIFVSTTGTIEVYNFGFSSINVKGRNIVDSLSWSYITRGSSIGVRPRDVRNIGEFQYIKIRNDNNSKYGYDQFSNNVLQHVYAHTITCTLNESQSVTFTVYTKAYLLTNYSSSDSFNYPAYGYFLYGDAFIEITGLRLTGSSFALKGNIQTSSGSTEVFSHSVSVVAFNQSSYLPL